MKTMKIDNLHITDMNRDGLLEAELYIKVIV